MAKVIEISYLQKLIDHGINVLPCKADKSPAITKWSHLKTEYFDISSFKDWVKFGIPCGAISGGLLAIDVDTKNDPTNTIADIFFDTLQAALGDTYERLIIVKTISGGFHVLFRCNDAGGNKKLTMLNGKCVIETRGEGGYVIGVPSEGYEFIQNNYFLVPTLSDEEKKTILDIALALSDKLIDSRPYTTPGKSNIEKSYSESPFEDYDQKNSIIDLLKGFGWRDIHNSPKGVLMRRPGKEKGISGIVYADNIFRCFTSSTSLEPDRSYRPYQLITFLGYNGDFKKASKELIAKGYGKARAKRITTLEQQNIALVVDRGIKDGKSEEDITSEALKFTNNKEAATDLINGFKANENARKNAIGDSSDIMAGVQQYFVENNYYINQITLSLMHGNKVVSETEKNNLYFTLRKIYPKLKLMEFKHFLKSTGEDTFELKNPLLEFFKTPNKTTGNIDRLYDCLNAPEDMRSVFRKWYIGIVRSIVDNKANIMYLLLVGIIKTGKTEFLKRLMPPELKMYTNMEAITDNKDFSVRMSKMILIINDETHLLNKKEASVFRQVISSENLAIRRVYREDDEYIPRLATLCGTSNDKNIIPDPANNRRIIPIELVAPYNFELYNSIDKSDALREAYYLYMNGFDCDLTGGEVDAIQSKKEYEEINDIHLMIQIHWIPAQFETETGAEWIAFPNIVEKLKNNSRTIITGQKVSRALTDLKFVKMRKVTAFGKIMFYLCLPGDMEIIFDESGQKMPF